MDVAAASGAVGAWEAALAADQAASYINLMNPGTYNLTAQLGTPTWTAGVGWGGFDTDTCLLYTGIDAPGDNKAMMIQFDDVVASVHQCVMGCASPLSGNTAFAIWPVSFNSSTKRIYQVAGAESEPTGAILGATMALSGGQPYLNGVADGSPMTPSGGTQSPIAIGAALRRTDAQGGFAPDGHTNGKIKRAIVWLSVPLADVILEIHEFWVAL